MAFSYFVYIFVDELNAEMKERMSGFRQSVSGVIVGERSFTWGFAVVGVTASQSREQWGGAVGCCSRIWSAEHSSFVCGLQGRRPSSTQDS